ncbi:Ku protein [Ancylobacter sp. A5.8]|uniref:non-homologous end joining protein Ku n=1 Tax=Ancylobacter gelatini TaxID=2919920 RepID=UPI001F4E2072|nr:Ku protein [Ancylobacter gelatini]MCJ8142255.1 Ku protein [Ancylobacter gelatini]
MAPRATWKGYLKLGELVCGVALHTAVSASERVSLSMVNRKTGHRLLRRFIDPETGEEVEREAQVKGYEVGSDDYVVLEPDEVAAAVPEGDKTLHVDAFIACREVDDLYFDRSYFLRPVDEVSQPTFAVIREGMRRGKVAAVASAVLFRRPRSLLIRAYDEGIVATTLNYDYEVRSAAEAFEDVPSMTIKGEMLDLARHIIETKSGTFQPETFDDAYDNALAELVRAKIEGRKIKPPKEPARAKVVDLMDVLRRSAGQGAPASKDGGKARPRTGSRAGSKGRRKAAPARKAG